MSHDLTDISYQLTFRLWRKDQLISYGEVSSPSVFVANFGEFCDMIQLLIENARKGTEAVDL